MASFEDLSARLVALGQEHILKIAGETPAGCTMENPLLQQVASLDLEASISHFKSAQSLTPAEKALQLQQLAFQPVKDVLSIADCDEAEKSLLREVAFTAMAAGQVAAVIMSGGQGTRLGFEGPKGMYSIGMPSNKSIFQMHLEKLLRVRQLCLIHLQASATAAAAASAPTISDTNSNSNSSSESSSSSRSSIIDIRVPVYIMTSALNHSIIEEFFKAHCFFGYPERDVVFFQQGLEPSFDFDGRVIVESEASLSLSPDGNGGIYRALQAADCLEHMQRCGVRHLHVYGIDNVLTRALDPYFLGACIRGSVDCGNKCVWRSDAAEKVGVAAQDSSGRMHILEYSEIPPHLAEQVDDSTGKLLFGAANICNHYLSVKFLLQQVLPNLAGTYHVAQKKIPYWDSSSKSTVASPATVNGIKIEMFIFDVFPLAQRWLLFEGQRAEDFAPVKNAPGSAQDSPDSARALLTAQARRWLLAAGAVLPAAETSVADCESAFTGDSIAATIGVTCEVSPLLSYEGEGLQQYSGTHISLPCYLHP